MAHKRLTDQFVARVKAPTGDVAQVDYFDLGHPALALRVGRRERVFTFHYREAGKLKRVTLGRYPEMSLAEAREAWRLARKALAEGRNIGRSGTANQVEFGHVIAEWLRAWRMGKAANTVKAVEGQLRADILPALSGRDIASIGKRQVLALLDSIVERGAMVKARRVFATLQTFFGWCVQREIIAVSPMTGLKRPGKEEARDRPLTDPELVSVLQAAEVDGYPFAPALRLLALCGGCREAEIGGLRWDEIRGNAIHLEGTRTKNGEAKVIPLSAAAQEVLATVPRISRCDYVFTSRGNKPIAKWDHLKTRINKRVGIPRWVFHDLRSTMATGLQRLGFPEDVIEACLGHAKTGVRKTYQRYRYEREKREAYESWGGYVTSLLGGEGKVVTLKSASTR